MTAGERDLEATPCLRLAPDLAEVGHRPTHHADQRGRGFVGRPCGRVDQLDPRRNDARADTPSSPHVVDRSFERLDPEHLDAADQPGLVNGRCRDDDPPQATTRERRDHRQHTWNRADLAAQRQLADEGEPPATWLDLFRTQQDPDRHRKVE